MKEVYLETNSGKLRGCIRKTSNGILYNCFLGIPYAKPPVGDLRFCDPQLPKPWTGVRDATFFRDICCQIDVTNSNKFVGSEDCLFLNVYTPINATKNEKLPVMFWIHGGGFMMGSGNDFGPDYLIERNVILVTFNYRLGALGFLCLDIPEVPGNAGMKDQVFALRWVMENIKDFGGDSDNITIFGQSAGGASVSYHIMSPMSKGLFHKAISQSGTSLAVWAYQQNPTKNVSDLLKYLKHNVKDVSEILNILRKTSIEKLTIFASKPYSLINKWVFSPTVEKMFNSNVEQFLPAEPMTILKSGNFNKIPYVIGMNSNEGYIFSVENVSDEPKINAMSDINIYIDNMLPRHLKKITENEVPKLLEDVLKFYTSTSPFVSYLDVLYKIVKDFYCLLDCNLVVNLQKLLNDGNPIFLYQFSFESDFNMFKNKIHHKFVGACHGDELAYLFPQNNINPTDNDIVMIKKMTNLWTDFAKYGNPTPTSNELNTEIWTPVHTKKTNYLDIGQVLKMQDELAPKNIIFLNELLK